MAEIDDDQLIALQRAAGLLQRLSSDPRTRGMMEKAVKVHHPEVQTTDDIAERYTAPVIERLDAVSKTVEERFKALDERENKLRDQEDMGRLEASFDALRKEGYTDDGLSKIKSLMIERNIADPQAAAALFDRQNPPPPAEQAQFEPSHWNYEKNSVTDTEALFADPDKWESQAIAQTLNDMRKPGGNV